MTPDEQVARLERLLAEAIADRDAARDHYLDVLREVAGYGAWEPPEVCPN